MSSYPPQFTPLNTQQRHVDFSSTALHIITTTCTSKSTYMTLAMSLEVQQWEGGRAGAGKRQVSGRESAYGRHSSFVPSKDITDVTCQTCNVIAHSSRLKTSLKWLVKHAMS